MYITPHTYFIRAPMRTPHSCLSFVLPCCYHQAVNKSHKPNITLHRFAISFNTYPAHVYIWLTFMQARDTNKLFSVRSPLANFSPLQPLHFRLSSSFARIQQQTKSEAIRGKKTFPWVGLNLKKLIKCSAFFPRCKAMFVYLFTFLWMTAMFAVIRSTTCWY